MKKFVFLSAFLFFASSAQAAVLGSLGDKDGYGIGATHGASFDFSSVGAGDGDGTDVWVFGDQSFTMTVNTAGVASAPALQLEIGHGGDGLGALTKVFIGATQIGVLTDGDDAGPGYNYYFRDVLDLTPYKALLTGSTTLRFDVATSGDGWALDFIELKAVPEPSTVILFLAGLLGLGLLRRRQARL